MSRRPPYSFRLSESLVQKLDKLAQIGNTSRNALVANLCRRYVRLVLTDMDLTNREHIKAIREQLEMLKEV